MARAAAPASGAPAMPWHPPASPASSSSPMGQCGRSGVGRTRNVVAPTSLAGQFEQPYGPMGPPTLFTIPVLRYMKTYGLTHEQLAMVSVVQREWAAKNPRVIPGRPALAGRPGDADHRRR